MQNVSSLTRLYHILGPIYPALRPMWTKTLTRRAESYLEQEVLPSVLNPASVVLDLGCGPASNLQRFRRLKLPFGRYVGCDLSPNMLAARHSALSRPAAFVLADAHFPPFAGESFEIILSTWMFSHLPEPLRVVEQAFRLLKPGGWLVVACFTRPAIRLGEWLQRVEATFEMHCFSPEAVFAWPGLVEVRSFLGRFNVVACLRKESL